MYEMELFVFLISGFFTFRFFKKWYQLLFGMWPPERYKFVRYTFGWLPVLVFIIILYTLKVLASFDVVNDPFYIIFYILLGYTWLYFGLLFMSIFFDLSWIDDAVILNNKAAVISVSGGLLGLAILYSGANIGDGPGWWCVIFAGGLGLAAWLLLALLINSLTQVFGRITIERDISCGIRFGLYLLAAGIILGRASAGDWTSFGRTIMEFMDGWPALPLTALAVLAERYYLNKSETGRNAKENYFSSVLWGAVYIILAVAAVMLLPPLKENLFYGGIPAFLQ